MFICLLPVKFKRNLIQSLYKTFLIFFHSLLVPRMHCQSIPLSTQYIQSSPTQQLQFRSAVDPILECELNWQHLFHCVNFDTYRRTGSGCEFHLLAVQSCATGNCCTCSFCDVLLSSINSETNFPFIATQFPVNFIFIG